MTKSTATVNCTAASISSRSHSLNGRRSESICGRGSAALSSVSEDCVGVVKTATFDADRLVVKARLGPSAIRHFKIRLAIAIVSQIHQKFSAGLRPVPAISPMPTEMKLFSVVGGIRSD